MSYSDKKSQVHAIRSFVQRQGRLTTGQKNALDQHWSRYGLQLVDGLIEPEQVFGRDAPLTVEIGFGNGVSLLQMMMAETEHNYLAMEVHRPGVGALVMGAAAQGIESLRIYNEDAVQVLQQCLPDESIDRLLLFFPDPWHKKKHNKRRILRPEFVELVAKKMKVGGVFHMATDWQHYAEQMLEVMEASKDYVNSCGAGAYAPRPDYRPVTKFEQRGLRLGHGVWDLIYQKKGWQ